MDKCSFLFLQGVASPFFTELEKAVIKAGHQALKVNFCGGDLYSGRFFKKASNHISYSDTLENLPTFYEHLFNKHQITDIILFGDTRPVHRSAVNIAKKNKINIHVFEEGYFRPHWITLEKGGVNAHSSMPKDPQFFLDYANHAKQGHLTKQLPEPKPTGGGLSTRAWYDVRYHLSKSFLKPLFPHYKTHRPDSALREYWGFIQRMPSLYFYYDRKAAGQISGLLKRNVPFYILPLQLDADSQIRLHSPVKNLTTFIQTCIQSFAQYAPEEACLVIKVHPLDPWFIDFPLVIKQSALENGLSQERLIYLESGNLNELLQHAKGTVLVNSTVGNSALTYDCPVIALGEAIYDISGLTFQGNLDDFWTQATPPNKMLFQAFRKYIIDTTQINGSFYNIKGIRMAIEGCLPFLVAEAKTGSDE
ncbi:MAG: capsular biosynthesis protein [Cocleimonas sp.]